MKRRALITGISGQDGFYLARLLRADGYEIHGTSRRKRRPGPGVAAIHVVDFSDKAAARLIARIRPHEIYNLAAPSFVPASWEDPEVVAEVAGIWPTMILEAIRRVDPRIRFFQASSSEMYGVPPRSPQTETTPFRPTNPYGAAKLFAHAATAAYRKIQGLFACSGILFNHESPRRGPEFVTRKITQGVAAIRKGRERILRLGDLGARRDWGFAGDAVRAMALMLRQREPRDFVIATGRTHTVREFCRLAFREAGLDWRRCVRVDPALIRPSKGPALCGDAAPARRRLGWRPATSFPDLVEMMVAADLAR